MALKSKETGDKFEGDDIMNLGNFLCGVDIAQLKKITDAVFK